MNQEERARLEERQRQKKSENVVEKNRLGDKNVAGWHYYDNCYNNSRGKYCKNNRKKENRLL